MLQKHKNQIDTLSLIYPLVASAALAKLSEFN